MPESSYQIDAVQVTQFFTALRHQWDWHHVVALTETGAEQLYDEKVRAEIERKRQAKKGDKATRRLKEVDSFDDRWATTADGVTWIGGYPKREIRFVDYWNSKRQFGAFATVAAFNEGKKKERAEAAGLSAFIIDIDGKNLKQLGVDSPEAAIPRVKQLLAARGIAPHAFVHSGHGLHVYLLIEQHEMSTAQERQAVEQVWYRLGYLFGKATDRHDLGSLIRIPGTWNFKHGNPVQSHFIVEHTDLKRARYSFAAVESAVADGPPLPKKERSGLAGSKAKVQAARQAAATCDLPVWVEHVLNTACVLDPDLAELRHRSRTAPKGERSDVDHAYAKELLRLGFGEGEVEAAVSGGAAAQERGDDYPSSTTSAARADLFPTGSGVNSCSYEFRESSGRVVYSLMSRAKVPATVPSPSPPLVGHESASPDLAIALSRPGDGKTFRTVSDLAEHGSGPRRVGFCSRFKGEILRHEYAINRGWPQGLGGEDSSGRRWTFDLGLPRDHAEAWALLPPHVREATDDKARLVWSQRQPDGTLIPNARFLDLKDPVAFYLNSQHPRATDESLGPEDRHVYLDEDGVPQLDQEAYAADPRRHLPAGALDERDLIPRAAAKFSSDPRLCLAGFDEARFIGKNSPCSTCSFGACRSNTNKAVLGARTLWGQSAFALLTHKSYETQGLHSPAGNHFDNLIVDELPDEVFRVAKIHIERSSAWDDQHKYIVRPLQGFIGFLTEKLETPDADLIEKFAEGGGDLVDDTKEILRVLRHVRQRLVKMADVLRAEARNRDDADAKKVPFIKVEANFDPLLTEEEFEALATVCTSWEKFGADDEIAEDRNAIQVGLLHLREFVGNARISVYCEHTFTREGRKHQGLWLKRFVSGWHRVLTNPDGSQRKTRLLDASAGIDPRYIPITGAIDEYYPEARFPNTSLVFTSKYRAKTKLHDLVDSDPRAFVEQIAADVATYVTSSATKLLIITDKDEARPKLLPHIDALQREARLPATTTVVWFGSLRGRNDFVGYDMVYCTHVHRLPPEYYVGLATLIADYDELPRQWNWYSDVWQGRRADDGSWLRKPTRLRDFSEYLRARWMVCDLYQDTLRIGIRTNPRRRAHIFIPTDEPAIVARLMRLFEGATIVLPDRSVISPPPFDGEDYSFDDDENAESADVLDRAEESPMTASPSKPSRPLPPDWVDEQWRDSSVRELALKWLIYNRWQRERMPLPTTRSEAIAVLRDPQNSSYGSTTAQLQAWSAAKQILNKEARRCFYKAYTNFGEAVAAEASIYDSFADAFAKGVDLALESEPDPRLWDRAFIEKSVLRHVIGDYRLAEQDHAEIDAEKQAEGELFELND